MIKIKLTSLVADSVAASIQGELKKKFPDVDIFIGGRGDFLTLSRIIVPEDKRSGGLGTQVMKELIKLANKHGKTIALTPSADFGGTKSRLVSFYKKFGFVENKGRNKDFRFMERMYRLPDSTTSEVIATTIKSGEAPHERKKKRKKIKIIQRS